MVIEKRQLNSHILLLRNISKIICSSHSSAKKRKFLTDGQKELILRNITKEYTPHQNERKRISAHIFPIQRLLEHQNSN
jgi:hypothetical protein